MKTKLNMFDIVLYNNQGAMSVGIINRIGIIGTSENDVLYTVSPNDVVIRSKQVTTVLGNAEEIKKEVESEE
jgi:hypothetical protein